MMPRTGELYKDLTNKIYQIITVAIHAETGEQTVVYQAMSGDYSVYARTLRQFTAEENGQRLFRKIGQAGCQPENAQGIGTGYQPENAEDPQTEHHSGNAGGVRVNRQPRDSRQESILKTGAGPADNRKQQSENAWKQERQPGFISKMESRPRTQSPAESKRALRQSASETSGEGAYYYEKRRRQMEEREQRREMFRKSERHESATEELRANPCLMKFLEADTYEEKFHVLNEIQNDMTDRLIDDIAVVLDVVIPEGALNDRFQQLRNIILTRQKYETNRFR